ncbi:hypothetical protein C723_1605 [Christiangramia flava JLT2011]|uniref:Uncharacterized protein n=1 Tax=Christiangramia flava JLT2011 TaxID=1229726 RepID=A0A1L7I9D4_9FLAO|nr:hypothetical protein GRFL_3493 [Christiangramia flava JLT2011]OSS39703.1 hypothetical protein C723_1605 [Christiangramia flava JLT2011]
MIAQTGFRYFGFNNTNINLTSPERGVKYDDDVRNLFS